MKNVKLLRSRTDKQLSGVIGGLGKLIGVDATILRIVYVLITLFSFGFPGVIVYVLCAIIIPLEKEKGSNDIIDMEIEKPAE